MEVLRLVISILFTIFAGANILYLLSFKDARRNIVESMCVSYCLGIGFISLQMLLLYFLNLKFNLTLIVLPWLILSSLIVISICRKIPAGVRQEKCSFADRGKTGALTVFLIAGILFESAFAFFKALIRPIESYDAIAIYAIKAKIFFMANSIPGDFFSKTALIFPHADYPLNIPLFETFIYLSLGTLNDQLVKVIFPMFFICVLVWLYFSVRRFAGINYALLFTFLLASMPQFNAYAHNAYLDLPFACYMFISAVSLFDWLKDKSKTSALVISALTAGLGAWTKNEGLMYCAAYLSVIIFSCLADRRKTFGEKVRPSLSYAAILASISLPWLYIKMVWSLANTDISSIGINPMSLYSKLYKVGPIIYEFQKQALGPKKWNIFWIIVFAAFLFNFRKAFTGLQKYVTLTIVLIVGGYVYFYLVSPIDIRFFLSKTWSRFLIQFLPISVYWLAMILKEDVTLHLLGKRV